MNQGMQFSTMKGNNTLAKVLEGFSCHACKTKNHPNLITVLEKEGKGCIVKGAHQPGAPVLTLVDTKSLPKELCASGEDEDGYSWEREPEKHATTCEEKYTAYIWKKWSDSSNYIKPWM